MKVAIIGAGNMGGATVWGLYRSQILLPSELHVANPSSEKLKPFAEVGIQVTNNNCEAASNADIVMVFVKPWLVESVLLDLKQSLDYTHQTLVVIAAGIPSTKINEWLQKPDESNPALFLAMPNIAIAVKSSMTFLVPVQAQAEQRKAVTKLFNAVGETLEIDERLMSAGTSLASCGLAYAMRYVRAASEGGVELGFYPDHAKRIVLQTVKGAVDLLLTNGNHPEQTIDQITTPGGLTIRGLNEMEHAGFTNAVISGLKAGI